MYRRVAASDENGLGRVLPHDVIAIEARGDLVPDPLFPDEQAQIENAVERRRLEFARGRTCARRALALMGRAAGPILVGADRAPLWEAGVRGSISHCRDYTCAIVGEARTYSGLGVDAEVLQALEPGVEKLVVRPAEASELSSLPREVPWTCVAFSAKEAFYKAQYTRTRVFLDFHDVDVAIDATAGKFTITVVTPLPGLPRTATGTFTLDDGRVLCAVALPA